MVDENKEEKNDNNNIGTPKWFKEPNVALLTNDTSKVLGNLYVEKYEEAADAIMAKEEADESKNYDNTFRLYGKLKVKVTNGVVEKKGAKDSSFNFQVKLTWNKKSVKTKVQKKNKDPVFNYEHTFDVVNNHYDDALVVELDNEKFFGGKFRPVSVKLSDIMVKEEEKKKKSEIERKEVAQGVQIKVDMWKEHWFKKDTDIGDLFLIVDFVPMPYKEWRELKHKRFPIATKIPGYGPTPFVILDGDIPIESQPRPSYSNRFAAGQAETGALVATGKKLKNHIPPNQQELLTIGNTDEWFVERRLNGMGAGRGYLRKVKDEEKVEWDYVCRHDYTGFEKKKYANLPNVSEARFVLDPETKNLNSHSIYIEYNENMDQKEPATILFNQKSIDDETWVSARKLFLQADLQASQGITHLLNHHIDGARYNLMIDRNLFLNPLKEFLRPYFYGTYDVDMAVDIAVWGDRGVMTQASGLTQKGLIDWLAAHYKNLDYKIEPTLIEGEIRGNKYNDAAQAFWALTTEVVEEWFKEHAKQVVEYWDEVVGLQKDMNDNGKFPDKIDFGDKDGDLEELKRLCRYLIFNQSFAHSFTHYSQYEDGGNWDYAQQGGWIENETPKGWKDPTYMNAAVTYTLTTMKMNPLITLDDIWFKKLRSKANEINPLYPISQIQTSVNV